ncbi:energy transducer TonB [Pseudidiomarina insulisalsae]|uniref:TonB C-terminal domain-containing protein n=1 Tax=Pseudidiomarina insulisalsae TaxID=575789 RepID=A0A432YF14_9GAMM|nr:energy transducer TonB [Pseudidiomarina insulisalsae]RUO59543.1 hypothetical protein CWI71_08990 [Pseudidiomarina insulisalsae]
MKSLIGVLLITFLVSGRAAAEVENGYSDLPVTENELQADKWSELVRFPARYPQSAVLNGTEGCATVEYVITPENEIEDIRVTLATNREFAIAAAKVVQKWKWADLPTNIISEPVRTQTKFDFCFNKGNQSCTFVAADYSCPGEDVIYSRGMRR